MRLLTHGGESVYYDPRTDRWGDSLAQAATLLGRTRLPATLREKLLQQRRKIEDALLVDGYRARRRPRRSRGQHALVRWTYWTYLAICPPNRTTGQIMEIIARCSINTQYLDRAIKQVLDLLRLPGRHVRPS